MKSDSNSKEKHARYEFKYVLDPVKCMLVKDFLKTVGIRKDPYAPSGKYCVTSLYFDSYGNDDYYDKSGGFLNRKKLRARIYGHDLSDNVLNIFLEVKHKHDMFISKDRKVIPIKEWNSVKNNEYNALFSSFNFNVLNEGRVPVFIVRYFREPFIDDYFSKIRLTLDSNIEVSVNKNLNCEHDTPYDTIPVLDSMTVMEIKFSGALPWWFGFMVSKFNLRRTSYSKYANSLEKIHSYNLLPR